MNVVLYPRVSTGKQFDKDLSIPDQIRQMEAYCKQRQYNIVGIYKERGATATDDKRPQFQRMIEDACCTNSSIEAIVVHSFSRFFRDERGFINTVHKLELAGVKLLSITQDIDDSPTGGLIRNIFSIFDSYQSK